MTAWRAAVEAATARGLAQLPVVVGAAVRLLGAVQRATALAAIAAVEAEIATRAATGVLAVPATGDRPRALGEEQSRRQLTNKRGTSGDCKQLSSQCKYYQGGWCRYRYHWMG